MRAKWLNNPENSSISTEALSQKLGQYTLEAMQLMDDDNAKRLAIVSSNEATKEDRTKALQSGIWYSTDYLLAIKDDKDYSARFNWLLKEKALSHGQLSKKLWVCGTEGYGKSKVPYTFAWKDVNQSPAEEIMNMLEGKSLCLLDCALVFNIAQWAALLRVCGKNKFDRIFSGKEQFTVPLCISNMGKINPIYFFLMGEKFQDASVKAGDKVGYGNHSDYPKKHGVLAAATGWNLVCSSTLPEIQWRGFGFGKDLPTAEIKQLLIDEYNKEVCRDPLIFVPDSAPCPDVATKINSEDFDSNPYAGFDGQIVRLNPKKVEKILKANEQSVNLLEVFKCTGENQLNYALDAQTKTAWELSTKSSNSKGLNKR